MDYRTLIALAEKVINSEIDKIQSVEDIATYSDAFAEWSASASLDAVPQSDLALLSERHARVIELAKVIQDETSADLKSVKSRARGILSYADYLPRKISMGFNKKG